MHCEFSVRWTSQLEAPATESYPFTGSADDSIKTFIDGKQLEGSEPIALLAGRKYDFGVEFRDNESAAFFKRYWKSPAVRGKSCRRAASIPPNLKPSLGNHGDYEFFLTSGATSEPRSSIERLVTA